MIGLGLAALWSGASEPTPTPPASAVARAAEMPPETPDDPARVVRAHLERFAANTGLTPGELDELAEVIASESQRYELEPELVLAVMHVESHFRTYAVSEKNAMGLMQILPSTGRWLAPRLGVEWHGPQTLFDPATNVRLGVAYLRQLLDRYRGDLSAALAAYNWGPGHIDRRLARGVPLPQEYARLVLHRLDRNAGRS